MVAVVVWHRSDRCRRTPTTCRRSPRGARSLTLPRRASSRHPRRRCAPTPTLTRIRAPQWRWTLTATSIDDEAASLARDFWARFVSDWNMCGEWLVVSRLSLVVSGVLKLRSLLAPKSVLESQIWTYGMPAMGGMSQRYHRAALMRSSARATSRSAQVDRA